MPMMGSYAANKPPSGLSMSTSLSASSMLQTDNNGKPCPTHAEQINSIYCVRCKTGICVQCAIGQHRMHSILDMDGFTSADSGKAVHDIEYLADWVQVQLKDVVTIERELVERYAGYKSTTNRWRDEVISLVDAKAEGLIHTLKSQISADREYLKQYESQLAARVSLLRRMKSAGQEQVSEKMGHEILSLIEKVENLHKCDTFSLIEVPVLADIIYKTTIEEILECTKDADETFLGSEGCPSMSTSSTQWDEDMNDDVQGCYQDDNDENTRTESVSGKPLNSQNPEPSHIVNEATLKPSAPHLPSTMVSDVGCPKISAAQLGPRSKSVDESYRKEEMVAAFGCQTSQTTPFWDDMTSHGDLNSWGINPPGHALRLPAPPLSAIKGYGPPPVALLQTPSSGARKPPSSVPARVTDLVKASSCPSINSGGPSHHRQSVNSGSGDDSNCEDPQRQGVRNKGIPLHSIEACIITEFGEERTVYSLDTPHYDEISDQASVTTEDISTKKSYELLSLISFPSVIHGTMCDPRYDQVLVKTSNTTFPINIYSCHGDYEQEFGVLDAYVRNTSGGICLDHKRGITLVVEVPYSLLQFSSAGEYIGRINIYTAKELSGVAYCSGPDLYAVTDTGMGRVWLVHPRLATAIRFFSSTGSLPEQLYMPEFIAYDPVSNLLAVSDAGNDAVKLFEMDGSLVRIYGREGSRLSSPGGVVFDHSGHVVVCDTGNCRVLRFWIEKHREKCECLLDRERLGGNHPWCLEITSEERLVVSTFSPEGTLPDNLCIFTASQKNQQMDVDF